MKTYDEPGAIKEYRNALLLAKGETISNRDLGDFNTVYNFLSEIEKNCKAVKKQLKKAIS